MCAPYIAVLISYSICNHYVASVTQFIISLSLATLSYIVSTLQFSTHHAYQNIFSWVTGSEQAQEATLSIQTRLAFNIEGREWHSKKHKQPRNPIISFLSWLLLCIYQPLILKMMIQEERESQGNPQFLFFQSSLYSSVSWKQRVSVKCVHIKKHFHCSGKKYTHTHKLQNISVSISESQICI